MDDCDLNAFINELMNTPSSNDELDKTKTRNNDDYSEHGSDPLEKTIKDSGLCLQSYQISRATCTAVMKSVGEDQKFSACQSIKSVISTEPYCHVKLDSIMTLKDSTKKLLLILEDIQLKTNWKHNDINRASSKSLIALDAANKEIPSKDTVQQPCTAVASAIKKLETQTKILDTIPIENEDDDCSIFKKLTRKCNCLKQQEYNDFIIHFNEESRFFTSVTGEIIKNLRILKKFLYIGGSYTKNALKFLNEGVGGDSTYTEKVEIVTGCAHSDICNVFEEVSIVIMCIAWPYKNDSYGDSVTQDLAAHFLHKLSQVEEGRRYLKYTSKITIDIKKVLRKKGSKLDFNTLEALHATLDAMHPQNKAEKSCVTFYCRPGDEGFGSQTTKALIYHRHFMTSTEIFTHLDVLYRLSLEDKGKIELTTCLRPLVALFKEMLRDYDNSEMNIIVANILNNIVSKKTLELVNADAPKVLTMAETSTEPIQKKNMSNQIPVHKKTKSKKHRKRKRSSSSTSNNSFSSTQVMDMSSLSVGQKQRVMDMSSFSIGQKRRAMDMSSLNIGRKRTEHHQIIMVPREN